MSESPVTSMPDATQAECHYCHLPVGAVTQPEDNEPVYCCFGCRFAESVTGATGDIGESRWTATALGLSVFCSMNVMMMTMALWSYASESKSAFEVGLADFLRYGALLWTSVVVLLLGRPLAQNTIEQLRRGVLSTDLLLLTGVVAAFVMSTVSTLRSQGHVYFEVSCVILVLVTLGRWLEASGRLQASTALDELERLIPNEVRVTNPDGSIDLVSTDSVTVGQSVRVLPGERFPMDGTILRGRAVVDEQFFTGESVAVEKSQGDSVLGGSLNLDGDVTINITAIAKSGALGRLVDAVRKARLAKGRYQILADQWSNRFFPIIATLSLGTFFYHGVRSDWDTALLTALSVTLIACPCALALATPLAVWAALSTAAGRGVLFRSGDALEKLARTRAIRWDKTGTLTTGAPCVVDLICKNDRDQEMVRTLASQVTALSNHVYSRAISSFLSDSARSTSSATIETIPGRGLKFNHDQFGVVLLGSATLVGESGLTCGPTISSVIRESRHSQFSTVYIGWSGQIRAAFLLEESLRPEALATIGSCRDMGLNMAVLTGDRKERADWLSRLIGIPVLGELTPEDKVIEIRRAHDLFGSIAMVGDGLNDAPSLAAADVGVAMGCGADVSRDTADLCLIPNDLQLLPWSIDLSRRTVKTIRQNLAWSFGYNGIGVVIAAFGWLHPAVAAVLMVASSLMVLSNSLRLRNERSSPSAPSLESNTHGLIDDSSSLTEALS